MNILAIDTAVSVLSVAVSAGRKDAGEEIRYYEFDGGLRHSELLLEIADTLIRDAGLSPADIDLAACMKGPGSFTGLRIGFAAVKGLALALGIPLVSAPTLDCMAAAHAVWPGIALPVIDAKQRRFFTALYREGRAISAYMDAGAGEIAQALAGVSAAGTAGNTAGESPPALLTGPGAALLLPELAAYTGADRLFLDPGYKSGRARELLAISQEFIILQRVDDYNSGPLYLRKSDAETALLRRTIDGMYG
jgi:tRNA threonylcarbamoyladenosine biosynthesis protein TsaB